MDQYAGIFLLNPDHTKIVLLKRSAKKEFAPNRWTGVGGHIEKDETVTDATLRELVEETGITQSEITNFRQIADFTYDGGSYWPQGYRIIWSCADYGKKKLPKCTEGTLKWIPLSNLARYDIIEDTKAILTLLTDQKFGANTKRTFKGKFLVGEKGVTDRVIVG